MQTTCSGDCHQNDKSKQSAEDQTRGANRYQLVWSKLVKHMSITVLCLLAGTILAVAGVIASLNAREHRNVAIWMTYFGTAIALIVPFKIWDESVPAHSFVPVLTEIPDGTSAESPQHHHNVELKSPRFSVLPEEFTFSLGNLELHITLDQLKRGPVSIIALRDGGDAPLTVSLKDGGLLLNADLLTVKGFGTVKIRENVLLGFPSSWDMNHNPQWTAVEIINSKAKPILQIVYRQPNHIVFEGALMAGNSVWLMHAVGSSEQSEIRIGAPAMAFNPDTADLSLARMFKYPAWKYPGEFEH